MSAREWTDFKARRVHPCACRRTSHQLARGWQAQQFRTGRSLVRRTVKATRESRPGPRPDCPHGTRLDRRESPCPRRQRSRGRQAGDRNWCPLREGPGRSGTQRHSPSRHRSGRNQVCRHAHVHHASAGPSRSGGRSDHESATAPGRTAPRSAPTTPPTNAGTLPSAAARTRRPRARTQAPLAPSGA